MIIIRIEVPRLAVFAIDGLVVFLVIVVILLKVIVVDILVEPVLLLRRRLGWAIMRG